MFQRFLTLRMNELRVHARINRLCLVLVTDTATVVGHRHHCVATIKISLLNIAYNIAQQQSGDDIKFCRYFLFTNFAFGSIEELSLRRLLLLFISIASNHSSLFFFFFLINPQLVRHKHIRRQTFSCSLHSLILSLSLRLSLVFCVFFFIFFCYLFFMFAFCTFLTWSLPVGPIQSQICWKLSSSSSSLSSVVDVVVVGNSRFNELLFTEQQHTVYTVYAICRHSNGTAIQNIVID